VKVKVVVIIMVLNSRQAKFELSITEMKQATLRTTGTFWRRRFTKVYVGGKFISSHDHSSKQDQLRKGDIGNRVTNMAFIFRT
jgi:hypothetical protein